MSEFNDSMDFLWDLAVKLLERAYAAEATADRDRYIAALNIVVKRAKRLYGITINVELPPDPPVNRYTHTVRFHPGWDIDHVCVASDLSEAADKVRQWAEHYCPSRSPIITLAKVEEDV